MLNFVRNFVSVGQGGFSIEKFYNKDKMIFCMVYDCGSNSFKSEKMKKKIKEHFEVDDKINALFISHFDGDHINGVSILLKEYCVDRIYLPILSKSEVLLLNASMTDKKTLDFINDPIKYISNIISAKHDNNINIIFVRKSNKDINDLYEEASNNDNIRISYINSGEVIPFKELNNNIWEYIPYNVSFSNYDELNKRINEKFGKRDLKEVLENNIGDLKKIYDEVLSNENRLIGEDTNQNNLNSLILYSGPIQESKIGLNLSRFCHNFFRYERDNICNYGSLNCGIRLRSCCCFDYSRLLRTRVGCLYFGDANAKDQKVIDLLNKHGYMLSFVQIPHHGSKYNNDDNILNNDLIFIIFAGTKNTYNHPSAIVIEKLNRFKKIYFVVTEFRESELIVMYDLYQYKY